MKKLLFALSASTLIAVLPLNIASAEQPKHVIVTNTPLPVTGSVDVAFPDVQSVTVQNLPSVQDVTVTNTPKVTVTNVDPIPVRIVEPALGQIYDEVSLCIDPATCKGPSLQHFLPVPAGKFLRIEYISVDADGDFVEGSVRLGALADGLVLGNLERVHGQSGKSLGKSVSLPFDESINCCAGNGFLVSINLDDSSTGKFIRTRVRVRGVMFPAD